MNNTCRLLVLLVPLAVTSACNRYYYLPNSMAMPAFEQQHDAVISAGTCDYGGWEFQAAYSPIPYVAVLYNQMNIPLKSLGEEEWVRGLLQEGGIGGYYGKAPWSFHLLGGYGQGFVENAYGFYGDRSIESRLDFRRWFLQPGFVLQTRHVRFGMAFRQIWLHYYQGSVDVQSVAQEELNILHDIEEETPFGISEFGLTLGFRIRPFTISYNSVNLFDNESVYRNLRFVSSNNNIMLTLDLYELWRGREQSQKKRKKR